MPQYQVDSERIQSSSAAVATSISQIRQAVGGMYTESIQRSLTQASTVYADAEIQASRLFAS